MLARRRAASSVVAARSASERTNGDMEDHRAFQVARNSGGGAGVRGRGSGCGRVGGMRRAAYGRGRSSRGGVPPRPSRRQASTRAPTSTRGPRQRQQPQPHAATWNDDGTRWGLSGRRNGGVARRSGGGDLGEREVDE